MRATFSVDINIGICNALGDDADLGEWQEQVLRRSPWPNQPAIGYCLGFHEQA